MVGKFVIEADGIRVGLCVGGSVVDVSSVSHKHLQGQLSDTLTNTQSDAEVTLPQNELSELEIPSTQADPEGDTDGATVVDDGDDVGTGVGDCVGDCVGVVVGTSVGDKVGVFVVGSTVVACATVVVCIRKNSHRQGQASYTATKLQSLEIITLGQKALSFGETPSTQSGCVVGALDGICVGILVGDDDGDIVVVTNSVGGVDGEEVGTDEGQVPQSTLHSPAGKEAHEAVSRSLQKAS